MPKLEIPKIVERLERIEEYLKKYDFKTARFLLKDLQDSFKRIDKCLENWERLNLAEV